ncbi:unnamed protein product [Prorocentrum cordatum]|uniref:Signal peptidase complex subunit 3 n=1 Tax=Prorocentrum cordatum TaxID=2364126 RepID=A0ABN9YFT8_9DINO|nr:unnamed protein product [Polarella glacialis]
MTSYLPEFATSSTGDIALNKVHDLTINTYLKMDQCMLSFDISHNLTSEFNWNMNQLFVYVVASYNSSSNKRNEVTIWDRIVTNSREAYLVAQSLKVEYPLRDQYQELRGKNVLLEVRYRTMPITGIMYTKQVGSHVFPVNTEYFRDESTVQQKPKKR